MPHATSARSFRNLLAPTALVGLCTSLAVIHQPPEDPGMRADAMPDTDLATAWSTDVSGAKALLVDFVEPDEGEGGSESLIRARASELGLSLAGPYAEGEHLYRLEGPLAQLEQLQAELKNDPLVEGVEPEINFFVPESTAQGLSSSSAGNDITKPAPGPFVPDDPMYPLQWHLDAIHAPHAWSNVRGDGAVVAVIDTGVAWRKFKWENHRNGSFQMFEPVPDLAGIEFVHPRTFVNDSPPDGLDDHAHGTHVAGTIAQATNNGIGVAGVAHRAAIMPLKVLAGSGRGSSAGVANAVRFAADNGAHVINMSLGSPIGSRLLAKAVAYAREKGTTVVCAAGNSGRGRIDYPAANEGCFAVAATTFSGERAFYSNWGKVLDISAPGGDTRSDENGDGYPDGVIQNTIQINQPDKNDYLWFMGTSMATPHVAGVAGLVASAGVTNPDEVESILKRTARHPNGVEWDRDFGAGHLDAKAAVEAAKSGYAGERSALAGVLAWMIFAGLGLFGATRPFAGALAGSRGGRALQWLSLAGVGAFAAGAFGQPLAHVLGTTAAGFDIATLGSGVFLSALLPLLLTLGLLQFRSLRPALAGLNLGWAALMVHGAVVLPTVLTGVPGGMAWDRVFLAVNALGLLWLARRISNLPAGRSS